MISRDPSRPSHLRRPPSFLCARTHVQYLCQQVDHAGGHEHPASEAEQQRDDGALHPALVPSEVASDEARQEAKEQREDGQQAQGQHLGASRVHAEVWERRETLRGFIPWPPTEPGHARLPWQRQRGD